MSHYIIEDGAFARAFAAMPSEYLLPWSCGVDEAAIGKATGGAATGGAGGTQTGKGPAKLKVSKLKYTCPTCKVNVWGKPGLRVRCDDCDQQLRCADGTTPATPATARGRPREGLHGTNPVAARNRALQSLRSGRMRQSRRAAASSRLEWVGARLRCLRRLGSALSSSLDALLRITVAQDNVDSCQPLWTLDRLEAFGLAAGNVGERRAA